MQLLDRASETLLESIVRRSGIEPESALVYASRALLVTRATRAVSVRTRRTVVWETRVSECSCRRDSSNFAKIQRNSDGPTDETAGARDFDANGVRRRRHFFNNTTFPE